MLPILRFVHVVFGIFWVGSVLFVTFVLMPTLKGAGPAGIAVMKDLGKRMSMIMIVAAVLTLGAGIWLMMILSGGAPGVWMQSTTGRTFIIGGALAILAFLIGISINAPAGSRMSAIGAAIAKRGGPPTPEEAAQLQRLQSRLGTFGVVVALLLLGAAAAMAVARYLH
jgi:hypothetical protein